MKQVALTPGCPRGIGPELFPLALSLANIDARSSFLWCGSQRLFVEHARRHNLAFTTRNKEIVLTGKNGPLTVTPVLENTSYESSTEALNFQKCALLKAIDLACKDSVFAIVTGPIRKEALQSVDGLQFAGQTELFHHYLAEDKKAPVMCFAGSQFLLGLATIHVPLTKVSSQISAAKLSNCIERLRKEAERYYDIPKKEVRTAVLGLNPHAGEDGLIGFEEKETISPTVRHFRKNGFLIQGPVAADGFFGNLENINPKPHVVLAMYHDQGLIPYKLLGSNKVINITLGLKVVRTSPAHGTADDIAGNYTANPSSLSFAIEYACKHA